ncbi:T9SS sorting signal type C domain-containing protein [Flavobacterium sp. LS2P90]|uniref:T9SS sorting signal type C domain-containing protein n=1 Tax=Flavobacterium xylosi TaxID=3230415 RepID=A0ABW6HUC3_9FLAO
MTKKTFLSKFNILIFLLLAFSVKTIGQTSTSGGAYIWSTATSWTPNGVPASTTNVSVNNPLTLDQNLAISTGNYTFNQDVTDQPGGSVYNLTNLNAAGSLTIASGTTTIGGVTNIGGNATFRLTVKSGATLILGTPESTSNNFIIGNSVAINIESGGSIIVYGNIVNSNSTGSFAVNGLLQVYGNYITDNGNIDISGTTGQFYTTGGMDTQGNSSEIYGSSNNCTSNCSGTSLDCGTGGNSYTAAITPQNQTVCSGGVIAEMTFTTNVPSATYQWEYSLTAGGTYSPVSGATSLKYTPVGLTVTTWYRVKYTANTSGCGTKYSAPVPVYVSASTYTQSTAGQTICVGGFGPISVSAFGTGLTYQWYGNNTASNSGGSLISGATSNVYTPSSAIGGIKYYYCIINSSCVVPFTTAVSGGFTVNLNSAGLASSSPTPCLNTLMTSITHTTTGATGIGTAAGLPGGVTASWVSNIITITGTPTTSGIFNYSIPLSGGCGSVSATGTITVNALPNNTLSSGFTGGSFCIGSQATITFDADDANGVPPYTLSYTDGTTTYSQIINSNAATAFNVSAAVSTGYTLKSITNFNGCVNLSPANTSANVTFRPNPSATISGTTTVCLGVISPNITFVNRQAAGITVTYTINGGANQTVSVVASGSANVPVPTTMAGSFVYALVSVVYSTNPSCAQTLIGSATVVINSLPSPPTVTITQPTCTVATGSISITAVSGETYSFDGGAYSGTLVYSSFAQGSSHTVSSRNASGCISTSVGVTVMSLITNTYSGTWSAGSAPPATSGTQNIVFNADFTTTIDLSGCSCQVNSGAVVIKSGHTLSLTNELTVSGGSLTFENNASLIQTNTGSAINTGAIIYKRNSTPIINDDYTYWSSPTSGSQTLLNFSPYTQGDKYFIFNNDWINVSASSTFSPGIGYSIRAPEGISASVAAIVPFQFTGVPNNGTVVVPVTEQLDAYGLQAGIRLVGNPYSSAIDADAFIDANITGSGTINKTITGTLYFWTHNHTLSGNDYLATDYATYTKFGGTGTAAAIPGTGNNSVPVKYIAAGQGFFVEVDATGNVTFNNAMRVAANNTNFYKTATIKASSVKSHRVWLNLTNSSKNFSQALMGYSSMATNEYDPGVDGLSFGGNQHSIYSLIGERMLAIQAKALPFDMDTIPIGYTVNVAGKTSISIDHVDGMFDKEQKVYLEDLTLGVIHDLKTAPYTFSSEAGTFNDRFVFRFKNSDKTLEIGDFETLNFSVLVSNTNKQIKINSSEKVLNKIQVYDLLGRLIYQKMNVNDTEFLISNLVSNQQPLLVKIILQNGQTVSKKIIY